MKRFLFLSIFGVLFLSGCVAKNPDLTREEWLKTTTRIYTKTPDQILNASIKLFRLADGDDFSIMPMPNAVDASRDWTVYLVLSFATGTDYWSVRTLPQKDGTTKVTVQSNIKMTMYTPTPTANQNYMMNTATVLNGTPVQGTALYDLFFARLEYLLGIRKEWMDCKTADERVKNKIVWGANEALCNVFNMKDSLPEELRK